MMSAHRDDDVSSNRSTSFDFLNFEFSFVIDVRVLSIVGWLLTVYLLYYNKIVYTQCVYV